MVRMTAMVNGHLEREVEAPWMLTPEPSLLEVEFGRGGEHPPLELDGLKFSGRLDRVDVDPETGAALVRDYKTGRTVVTKEKFEEMGSLQAQLYTLAVQEILERDPLGALYVALGGNAPPIRGFLRGDRADDALSGVTMTGKDRCDEAQFDEVLARGRERAVEVARAIRGGKLDRNPLGGECPRYCTFQSICRMERATGGDPDAVEADDDEGWQ
jgi:ATP-dependent helicase/DNAse subunit B